ncbi:MAG: hypothetical protein M1818_007994 [Claussenomyces sp. TS43310]|nr:MAG: hypothetical protein M1818_007994 [Claussenomyces sp. TS43310]
MPALQRIIPSRAKEFWDALDPDNMKQVLEAVKEEFKRPEPAHELHYLDTMSRGLPIGDSKPCYRDCLIFLLRGEFIIKGQGRVTDTGCAYRVKDEAWIWLCGTTTLVVMEEGEQRAECLRRTQDLRELILAERDGTRKERRAKKLLNENRQALSASSQLHRPW